MADAAEEAFGFRVECYPFFAGSDLRAVAIEERESDGSLKILDEARDLGLGTIEQPGGASDAACRHHCKKRLELPYLHDDHAPIAS